ncbi:MAG: SGNH/GDSL hydrolase N-terminal domain-containing protein, partial [Oceanipulchritudo sp.]
MCWIWDLSVQSAGLYVDFQTNATEIFVRWTLEGDAVDGIIDCRLGRSREVSETLGHLSRYFRLPFLITTESPANERLPFLTGMGGFLQFVANGMAGLITDQPGGLAS